MVAAPWATLAIEATMKIKSPAPLPALKAVTNCVSIAGKLWCKPVKTIGEYKAPKIPVPTNPNVSYNQTIPFVSKSERSFITGPTTINVKNPVKRTEINGVNVKSTAAGSRLCNHFSKMESIQTAANAGIT